MWSPWLDAAVCEPFFGMPGGRDAAGYGRQDARRHRSGSHP